MCPVKARIGLAGVAERAQKQPRGNQQREGESDLRDNQAAEQIAIVRAARRHWPLRP